MGSKWSIVRSFRELRDGHIFCHYHYYSQRQKGNEYSALNGPVLCFIKTYIMCPSGLLNNYNTSEFE